MITHQQLHTLEPDNLAGLLRTWRKHAPLAGVLMLLPEAEKDRLPGLQRIFQDEQVPLAGAIFPALVSDAGFVTQGAWLICLDPMPAFFLIDDLATDGARRIAAAATPPAGTDQLHTLFVVFDAMVPNIASMLNDVAEQITSPMRYAGVNAGSETFQSMPCLFDSTRLIGNGMLGLLLDQGAHSVVQHGYEVSKSLMTATSSTGNRIAEINHRPAFEVYREIICAEYGVVLTAANFYEYAVHFPFGVVLALDVVVRIPVALNEDGSLLCVGEVPANSLLRLLKAPAIDKSQCITQLANGLSGAADAVGSRPSLMTFYCAGRRMHFGELAQQEIGELKQRSGAREIFGALTLGEVDTDEVLHLPRFHNAALVCVQY